MNKLSSYIKNTKLIYNNLTSKCKVVIGNQSADLDSISSAISLSYYFFKKNSPVPYIPIINSNKKTLQTKKECMLMLDFLSIDLNDLIFINEWNKDFIQEVILVDHNEIDDQEKSLDFINLVTSVIDHHVDKQNFLDVNPRIIDNSVGSNSTLISEMFFKEKIELGDEIITLLLFPLLSDTNNLTVRAGQKDFEMFEYLTSQETATKIDPKELYKKIEDSKFQNDITESTNIILKKDYKQYEMKNSNWGMSSITFSVFDWLESDTDMKRFSEVCEFINEKELYFFAILSCFKTKDGVFKRDMALFSSKELISKFETDFSDAGLALIPNKGYSNEKIKSIIYKVNSESLTRKYWQPKLEEALKIF